MKIALLQCNPANGIFNDERLANLAASIQDADLCVASFGALAGSDPVYLYNSPDFSRLYREALAKIAADFPKPIILGCPGLAPCLIDKEINLDLGGNFYFKGMRFSFLDTGRIEDSDCILDLAPWPYEPGFQERKEKELCKLNTAAIAVNIAGGGGSLVYNGQSFATTGNGKVACRACAFEEDAILFDPCGMEAAPALSNSLNPMQWQALVTGVRDFVHKSGNTDVILGLSGGIDSALTACIATEALGGGHVHGVLMPSPYSSEGSLTDSRKLAQNLGMPIREIPINSILASYKELLEPVFEVEPPLLGDVTWENVQARIRGMILMALANRLRALVLNTGNKSELAMGYSTLYGDSVGALAVIGDLYKTRVYELADWYCREKGQIIPEEIMNKPPSAELRPNQKDSDSLPEYSLLDPMLEKIFNKEAGIDEVIRGRVVASRFKRNQCPPALLVGGNSIKKWEKIPPSM